MHTNGIILKRPINKNQILSNDLEGDLKYEGCSWCEIILNSNNYIWMENRN